ncbi:LysR family transcriptional regulator [Pseudonocardia sp. TRM90224]|uniref:LysR family transcriptional regulator n=1 Tax=Pseudonocardia sp. TRM90224 TaxID=2812678 RepID=UPI001E4E9254|nr:LysR family transcriptional regulator [Pseudonocardia sp. TRM90224]
MDLVDLRLLVAVAEGGSFTAAAQRLRYTQSAVSRRVAALERAAEVALFHRDARGVRLTAAGEVLNRHARTVLRAVEDAEAAVDAVRAGAAGPVRIGSVPTGNAALVPRALARLEQRNPDVELRFREGGSVDLAEAVVAGDLDLAVVFASPLDRRLPADVIVLASDPLMVAMPRGHRLSAAASVGLADLAGERWVQGAPDVADELFAAADPAPECVFRVREWTAKQGFVAAGLGLTVVPSLAAEGVRPDVVLRPLRGAGSARRVAAVLPRTPAPAARKLLTLLREVAAELAPR